MPRTTTIPLILRGEADASKKYRARMAEPDWAAEGLLDGLEGQDREARLAILRDLHADGVPLEDLRKACEENRLMFLPVERALREEPRYSTREIAEKSGTRRRPPHAAVAGARARDRGSGRRLSTASATSRPRKRIKQFLDAGVPPEGVIDMARVLGQSLSRVAEASRFLMGTVVPRAGLHRVRRRPAGTARTPARRPDGARRSPTSTASSSWTSSGTRSADRSDIAAGQRQVTVCFADIVGWTELSEEAEQDATRQRRGPAAARLRPTCFARRCAS